LCGTGRANYSKTHEPGKGELKGGTSKEDTKDYEGIQRERKLSMRLRWGSAPCMTPYRRRQKECRQRVQKKSFLSTLKEVQKLD